MKLYYAVTSPYARKVRVLLLETGQAEAVEQVLHYPVPTDPQAGYMRANPLSKLPALERPDGPVLYDSRVICAYLDARAEAGLYPAGARRWDTLVVEATGDGIMDAALLMTYEYRLRPPEARMEDWIEGQWAKAESACAALDRQWADHLSGPLDMGQISVACALAYLDFRHGGRDWRGVCPALAAWFEKFDSRRSMAQTRPEDG